jgi:phosphoglycolate phosphatase-like HAD superfamily hydrolase
MPLFQMMERLNVSRHQVLYMGDMAEDVVCAHFAGVRSVAVASEHSYHTAKRLDDAKPDYMVSNLGVLQQILAPEIRVMV